MKLKRIFDLTYYKVQETIWGITRNVFSQGEWREKIGEDTAASDILSGGVTEREVEGVGTGLPNQKGHALKDYSKSWRIPNYNQDRNVKRMNRYLEHMQRKVESGDLRVASIVANSSKAFWVMSFHRANSDWYWKIPWFRVQEEYQKYVKSIKTLKREMEVYRFYLTKPNGKLRPIGAPAMWSKALYRSLEMIVRTRLEPSIGAYQHGFVKNKNCSTACQEVIDGILANKRVYVFDLSGFFNNVNPRGLTIFLKKKIGKIANYIFAVTDQTIPKLPKDLQRENGLEIIPAEGEMTRIREKPEIIHKKGYTQGSPLSPILSIFALEAAGWGRIEGLTMFADDGCILRDEEADVESEMYNRAAKVLGIHKAEAKENGWVREDGSMKFLGVYFDLKGKRVGLGFTKEDLDEAGGLTKIPVFESDIDEDHEEVKKNGLVHIQWVHMRSRHVGKVLSQARYQKKEANDTWNIDPNSLVAQRNTSLEQRGKMEIWAHQLKYIVGKAKNWITHQDKRTNKLTQVDWISESSACVKELLSLKPWNGPSKTWNKETGRKDLTSARGKEFLHETELTNFERMWTKVITKAGDPNSYLLTWVDPQGSDQEWYDNWGKSEDWLTQWEREIKKSRDREKKREEKGKRRRETGQSRTRKRLGVLKLITKTVD